MTGEAAATRRGAPTPSNGAVRLVARQISELLFARSGRWSRLIDSPERGSGLLVEFLLGASIAHLPLRDPEPPFAWHGIEQAAAHGKPLTAFALARSMRLPYHTTRRRMLALHARGWLADGRGGYTVPLERVDQAALEGLATADAAALGDVLCSLAASGYKPAERLLDAGFSAIPAGVVERSLLTLALRVLETFTALYGDMVNGAICAMLVALNVRHITLDPELAHRFAPDGLPPPDELRRPISIRTLARTLELPFETVRRRVVAMTAQEWIVPVEGGYIVPVQMLTRTTMRDTNRQHVRHFERMLRELGEVARSGTISSA